MLNLTISLSLLLYTPVLSEDRFMTCFHMFYCLIHDLVGSPSSLFSSVLSHLKSVRCPPFPPCRTCGGEFCSIRIYLFDIVFRISLFGLPQDYARSEW